MIPYHHIFGKALAYAGAFFIGACSKVQWLCDKKAKPALQGGLHVFPNFGLRAER